MGAEDRFASHLHAGTFGTFPSLASSDFDQFSFKFGKSTQHRQHQSSGSGGCVRPGFGERFEQTFLVGDLLYRCQKIDSWSRQPIQPGDNDDTLERVDNSQPVQIVPLTDLYIVFRSEEDMDHGEMGERSTASRNVS
jgi:hypothetical protein